VPKPIFVAAVGVLKLVESRPSSSKERNKLPQKEHHIHVQRPKSEESLEKHSNWVTPPLAFALLEFLEQEETKCKARDPKEDITLEVSLEDQ
jgi:hypothetical protein